VKNSSRVQGRGREMLMDGRVSREAWFSSTVEISAIG
jgi:hypothetical protein